MRSAAALALLLTACAAAPLQQETQRALTCARLSSGQITCQGHTEDFHPITGIWRPFERATPTLMAGIDDAEQLALAGHVYALRADRALWRWEGPALNAPPAPAPPPPAPILRLISGDRLCADLDDGQTWCLYEDRWTPQAPPPPRLTRWEEPGGVLTIAARGDTRCALTGDNALACYGWLSGRWPLGPGLARDLRLEGAHGDRACLTDGQGAPRCFDREGAPTPPPAAPSPCALTDQGAPRCPGDGPLARHAPTEGGFVELVTSGLYACARGPQGVTCWGESHDGALGDPAQTQGQRHVPLGPAQALAASGGAACALLQSGDVACWGSALLVAPDAAQTRQPPTLQPALAQIELLVAGSGFFCALRQGAASCWGSTPE